MKKILFCLPLFLFFSVVAFALPPNFGFKNHGKIFETGRLKVSNIHEIYYELSGNPKGKPFFVLHGGPGTGMSPNMRGLFDPKKFMVVLFDQRGSGKSAPLYELRQNTTGDLVEDIEKLRKHLKLDKIYLIGGSWGSTLALAYAEKYPKNVAGIILRAVFLGTKEEEKQTYYSGGVGNYFPEWFEKIATTIKPGAKDIDRPLLMKYIMSSDPKVSEKFAALWSSYEMKITGLNNPDDLVEKIISSEPSAVRGLAIMETQYTLHNWFLKPNQLINNAYKLKDIPLIMVNGRYDMMCPPVTAYRLHKLLPKSKLWIVEAAGHSDWDLPVANKLLEAVKEFE